MKNRAGVAAIIITFLLGITLIVIVAALSFILTSELRETGYRVKERQAFYLAEAGLEKAIVQVQASIETTFQNSLSYAATLAWIDTLDNFTEYLSGSLETGSFSVKVTTIESQYMQKIATFSSKGTAKNIEKTIEQEIVLGFDPSMVFDYAYFINNLGWLFGGAQYFEGDMRANGDFLVKGSQRIDGDVYASGDIDESQGSLFYNSMEDYYDDVSDRARPGDPPAPGGDHLDGGYDAFADLYDASGDPRDPAHPQTHPHEDPVEMPYLGDLTFYETVAQTKNGTISQGGSVIVDNVHSGDLVLVGTAANPIEIDGPVVVGNDVIIKGVVEGQGTIYAGRNVHIIDDITYADAPSWPKPDNNPDATAAANANKDLLALCAKGNVIIGNYNHPQWNYCKNFLKPPFTKPYQVDATDASIGYVSYYQNGDPYFDGNYTAYDGGTKSDSSQRRFYESSLSNAEFAALNPTAHVQQVDALIYNNHAVTGRIINAEFNGSVISRDEALVFQGSITVNYDYRVKQQGAEYVGVDLPIALMQPERGTWSE